MANEVTKIGKKLDKAIADMKKLAPKFVKASGDKKQEILDKFENDSVDYIMVDGAHEYEPVNIRKR